MSDVRVELNKAGWDAIALSPEVLAACMAEAERGKAFAVGIAPVDTREYSESFDVDPDVVTYFRSGPRVAARLVNTAEHAAAVEFGNEHVKRPHRVLGRTAAYLGAR